MKRFVLQFSSFYLHFYYANVFGCCIKLSTIFLNYRDLMGILEWFESLWFQCFKYSRSKSFQSFLFEKELLISIPNIEKLKKH